MSQRSAMLKQRAVTEVKRPLVRDTDLSSAEFGLGVPEEILDGGIRRLNAYQKRVLRMVLFHLAFLAGLLAISIGRWSDTNFALIATELSAVTFLFALFGSSVFTMVLGSTRIVKIVWLVCTPLLLLALVLNAQFDAELDIETMLYSFPAIVGFAFALYIGMCGRQLKNLAPYLTIAFALASFVFFLFHNIFQVSDCAIDFTNGSTAPLIAYVLITSACVAVVVKAVHWVSEFYTTKKLSDNQVQICSWMILMSLSTLIGLQVENEDSMMLTSLAWVIPLQLMAAIALYLYITRQQTPCSDPQRLLLLRVFSPDKRGEKTLAKVEQLWRHIGPIYFIAGPDLAKTGADPDELYLYLTGRIKSLFIGSMEQIDYRLNTLDNRPDPDKRFRVNELFCYEDIWESVAQGLVNQSDSILLDLRGFNLSRLGTAKEIAFLAEFGAFPRTLILVDANEKVQEYLDTIHAISGLRISPDQFVIPVEETGASLVSKLLELRQQNLNAHYTSTTGPDRDYLDNTTRQQFEILKLHQATVDSHKATRYRFSWLLLAMGLAGMFLAYGLQFLPAFYLMIRRVKWRYVMRMFAVSTLFTLLFAYLHSASILPQNGGTSGYSIGTQLTILLACVIAWLFAWIPFCRHANRWIAEAREPLCTAFRYIATFKQKNRLSRYRLTGFRIIYPEIKTYGHS